MLIFMENSDNFLSIDSFQLTRRDFSLSVPHLTLPNKGLFRISGENGSGKSTLLAVLAGVSPYNQGIIKIKGRDLHAFSRMQCAEQINYLPQLAENIPSLLGQNFLEQGLYAGGASQIEEVLHHFDMKYLLEKRCDQCSGGEIQILRFIRACASLKPIILLDEPESFLSRKRRLLLMELLEYWASERLVVVSSHAEISKAKSLLLEETSDNMFILNFPS
ncbi:MAG: ATP-binding cassette domain-containing protein [Brevinema sp.]